MVDRVNWPVDRDAGAQRSARVSSALARLQSPARRVATGDRRGRRQHGRQRAAGATLATWRAHCRARGAHQMNRGAQAARGDVLLFLHADTRAGARGSPALDEMAGTGREWGRFDVRIDGGHGLLRVVGALMNLRSRLTGICTGDQAIFVSRELFLRLGAYPPIALMEDIALSHKLRRVSHPLCVAVRRFIRQHAVGSAAVVRTILLMWWLRLRLFRGRAVGKNV